MEVIWYSWAQSWLNVSVLPVPVQNIEKAASRPDICLMFPGAQERLIAFQIGAQSASLFVPRIPPGKVRPHQAEAQLQQSGNVIEMDNLRGRPPVEPACSGLFTNFDRLHAFIVVVPQRYGNTNRR